MEELPVTLIVKAPNQQVADQTVTCEPSWTIGKLKGHLSRVYPSQPKSEEQKLIYSGRLLPDTCVLKDVLRKFEGQDTHTVHLVCTPPQAKFGKYRPPEKKASTPSTSAPSTSAPSTSAPSTSAPSTSAGESSTSAGDGIRHRTPAQATEQTGAATNAAPPQIDNGYNPYSFDQEQMAAWANQFRQWSGSGFNPAMAATGVGGGFNPAMPPPLDPMLFAAQMAWMQHVRMQQYYNAATFHGNYQPYGGGGQQPINPNGDNNAPENRDAAAPVLREEPENANDGADGEHRDWLDWFYNMSRWILMFSIVYFYSNPIRFLTVFMLGTFIYLFQARMNEAAQNEQRRGIADNINNNYRPQAANNNNDNANINNNNNEPAAQNNEVAPENNNGEVANEENDENNPLTVNENNANEETLLSITWSAFTSFFTSLIPEVPNGRN